MNPYSNRTDPSADAPGLFSFTRLKNHRFVSVLVVAIFTLSTSFPVEIQAQVSGISYTLSPTATRMHWDGDAALEDAFLYGGELGFGFGEFVELSAVFLTGSDVKTDWREWSKSAGFETLGELASRKVGLTQYGGRLRVNFSRGQFVPFVTLGTGVIRFDPSEVEVSENIYAEGGVGLTFAVASRYTFSLSAGGQVYRFNPGAAFLSSVDLESSLLTRSDFAGTSVYNPTVSASVKVYLGGRTQEGLTDVDRALMSQFRAGNFGLAVEPFYGQIIFNKALDFPDQQRLGGLNVGFDLGPYLGLRGFYWQGVNETDPFDFQHIAFYGGEVNFRFQQELGGSITPFLTFGGGYVDVGKDKYVEETHFAPDSRYFALVGGGVEVPLSSALNIQGGVRSLLMSVEQIDEVSSPGSVYGSFMYTAGLNFNLGGRGRTAGTVLRAQGEAQATRSADRAAALEVQLASMRMRLDSLENAQAILNNVQATRAETVVSEAEMSVPTDTSGRRFVPSRIVTRQDTVYVPTERKSNISGQTITVPVPEVGEIYIRFGPPDETQTETTYAPPVFLGSAPQMMPAQAPAPVFVDSTGAPILTEAQIRGIISQSAAEWQLSRGITADELEESLRRLEARIEQRIILETARNQPYVEPVPYQQPAEVDITVSSRDSLGVVSRSPFGRYGRSRLIAFHPLIGLRTGAGPDQFLIGAQAKVAFSRKSFVFLPEYLVGLGDKFGHSLFGNLAWELSGNGRLRPYAGVGIGFISDRGLRGLQMSFNMLLGAEFTSRSGSTTWFTQLSTLDFFNINRIFFGYRLRL